MTEKYLTDFLLLRIIRSFFCITKGIQLSSPQNVTVAIGKHGNCSLQAHFQSWALAATVATMWQCFTVKKLAACCLCLVGIFSLYSFIFLHVTEALTSLCIVALSLTRRQKFVWRWYCISHHWKGFLFFHQDLGYDLLLQKSSFTCNNNNRMKDNKARKTRIKRTPMFWRPAEDPHGKMEWIWMNVPKLPVSNVWKASRRSSWEDGVNLNECS